jgi:hypothetical protein
MKNKNVKVPFETCIGCGAAISIKVGDDDYCPKCVGNEARFDALVKVVMDFGKSLKKQGYDSHEVKDALEAAAYRVKEESRLNQAA